MESQAATNFDKTTSSSFLSITAISWNICEAKASAAAPNPEQRRHESSRLIREECLTALLSTPDVIALQECPSRDWGQKEFGSFGYVSMGTQMSHCGWVDLLIRRELKDNSKPIQLNWKLPSVACVITLPNNTEVAFSSSHLSPFNDGARERASEFAELAETMTSVCSQCVMLGDYNMRQSEDYAFENMSGQEWVDAWKECGSNPMLKFTWDTFTK